MSNLEIHGSNKEDKILHIQDLVEIATETLARSALDFKTYMHIE